MGFLLHGVTRSMVGRRFRMLLRFGTTEILWRSEGVYIVCEVSIRVPRGPAPLGLCRRTPAPVST